MLEGQSLCSHRCADFLLSRTFTVRDPKLIPSETQGERSRGSGCCSISPSWKGDVSSSWSLHLLPRQKMRWWLLHHWAICRWKLALAEDWWDWTPGVIASTKRSVTTDIFLLSCVHHSPRCYAFLNFVCNAIDCISLCCSSHLCESLWPTYLLLLAKRIYREFTLQHERKCSFGPTIGVGRLQNQLSSFCAKLRWSVNRAKLSAVSRFFFFYVMNSLFVCLFRFIECSLSVLVSCMKCSNWKHPSLTKWYQIVS